MRALIAIAFVCCISLAAALEPPIPSGGKGVQKQDGKTSESAKNSPEKQRGTATDPIFIKSLPGEEREADARHKEYEHHEKPTIERLTGWGTLALAIFTFLLFAFTAALWWVTLQLSRDAKKVSERQAKETKDSLDVSRQAANAATKAVEHSEKELRAYIFVAPEGAAGLDKDGCFFATFSFVNYGKTPATKVRCTMLSNLYEFPLTSELETIVHSADASNAPLGAGDGGKQFPTFPHPLKDVEQEAILAGTAALYFWGEVAYLDIFGKQQATQFRMYCVGDDFERGHLAFHAQGNGHT